MRAFIKKAIKAGITIPASCLRSFRRYDSLASIRSLSSPRVLIIACHWIGDTLWAAQVVPFLRNLWPDGYLACITKPVCAPIWSGELAVGQCIESTAVVSDRRREATDWSALRRLSDELTKNTWDLIVDLTGNRYSAILAHRLRARHTLGFGGGEFGALYTTYVMDAERPGRHLSERPFRVIEPLLGEFAYPGVVKPPQPAEPYETAYRRYGIKSNNTIAVLAPGAGWPEKEWGVNNFSWIANKLHEMGYHCFVTGSPKEKDICLTLSHSLSNVTVSTDPLDKVIPLLSGASFFFGNDSGLGHLSAAFGIPVMVFFTGETPLHQYRPLGNYVKVFDVSLNSHTQNQIMAEISDMAGTAYEQ